MKKLISIVCVVLVVFCMINVFEEKPQAVFVADDAFIVSVIGSVLLSIAVSEGIALATGGESVYTGVANALWDYFLTGEAQGDVNEAINKLKLYGSFVYQGGKFYFALNQNGYNFFRSWLMGIDFNDFRYMSHFRSTDVTFISGSTGYSTNEFPGLAGHYVCTDSPYSTLTFKVGGVECNWTPGNGTTIIWDDGSYCLYPNTVSVVNGRALYLLSMNPQGAFRFFYGYKQTSNGAVLADSIAETDCLYNSIYYCNAFENITINGITGNITTDWYSGKVHVFFNNKEIFRDSSLEGPSYRKACAAAGKILVNYNNNLIPINCSVDNTGTVSTETVAEFEEVAPAIPNNTGIGRNQVALIPVPGNTVDSEDESIVLSPGQVKDYDREGKDYTFIPVPGQLQGKTGADLGVAIMNKTTFEETSTPVYTGSVPDVFPTASPDVTITAGADVFPTVAPTESPTAGEGSTADAIAGDIADIKDEVGDLSTPLTPPQAQTGTNKLKIPQLLLTKFPFCIPYDFYNAINQFNAEAEMPSFDIPFHFAQINFDYTMHIDFERFTTLAKICQWFFSVSWVVILILLTRKVIWK